jgi:hypothetical protein
MAPSQEIVIRAVGTALAGLSFAFAVYMFAYGGGKTRIYGIDHLAIFAQPRGPAATLSPVKGSTAPPKDSAPIVDMATTGSLDKPTGEGAPHSQQVEIIAAREDRVWLRINGLMRTAAPGDNVAGIGHIAAIVADDAKWVLLDDRGGVLLTGAKNGNGAAHFVRKMIFE